MYFGVEGVGLSVAVARLRFFLKNYVLSLKIKVLSHF